jgi:hypothetical protein
LLGTDTKDDVTEAFDVVVQSFRAEFQVPEEFCLES